MIVISPWSRSFEETLNAKNYPYWQEVVDGIKQRNIEIVQVGVAGEEKLKNVDRYEFNQPFEHLEKLLQICDIWIGIDNFFQHFNHATKQKRGIVLWGKSNPKIFGYSYNLNLLRAERFLRHDQFGLWQTEKYVPEAFVRSTLVLSCVDRELDL